MISNEFNMKVAILLVIGVVGAWAGNAEQKTKLLKHLFENYNDEAEPDNPDLHFNVGILCALYDREDKTLKTTAWERYKWNDNRLSWIPAEYGSVEVLRVHSSNLWLPDFKLYNSINHEDKRQESKAVVHHDGTVLWVPAVTYKSLCDVEENYYECNYTLGSWAEDSLILPLSTWHLPTFSNYLNSTCRLLPTSHSSSILNKHYPCCSEPYASLELSVRYIKNPEIERHGHMGHGHGRGRGPEHEQ